ncbi:cellulose biosynthesis cyclic di-GMP-binding regulatory protein BcsB [Methylobacterium oryzae CBMB20]
MTRRAVVLPLRLLRPGQNRIALRAELPRADDRACPDEAAVPTERLFLAATSRLTLPPLARIGRQPELAETVAEAFPYATAGRRPTLVVPNPDRDTMAAAATSRRGSASPPGGCCPSRSRPAGPGSPGRPWWSRPPRPSTAPCWPPPASIPGPCSTPGPGATPCRRGRAGRRCGGACCGPTASPPAAPWCGPCPTPWPRPRRGPARGRPLPSWRTPPPSWPRA